MSDAAMRKTLFHRLVERLLPWFDPEAEAIRNARSEAIRKRAIAARIRSEHVRADYAAMGRRLTR
jgi:hypothetical protein